MVSREEWLSEAMNEIVNSDTPLKYHMGRVRMTVLPSFPSRASRTPQVGDLVRQEDGTTLALVSPMISASLEVTIVAYWLHVRRFNLLWEARQCKGQQAASRLAMAGFNYPTDRCVPTERLIDTLAPIVGRVVDRIGEYPAEDVNLRQRRTQTTRLLKVECNGSRNYVHDPYLVRMSAAQFDRGAPQCGVCGSHMKLAAAVVA